MRTTHRLPFHRPAALALGVCLAVALTSQACAPASPKAVITGGMEVGGDGEGESAVKPGEPLGDLSAFDGCQRDVSPGLGVFYMCEHLRFAALITEVFPWKASTRAGNLEDFARSVGQRIHGRGGEVSMEPGELDIEGRTAALVRYSARALPVGPDMTGSFAAAPVSGGVRVVACYGPGDWEFDGCDEVLRLLGPERVFGALKARYQVTSPIFAGRYLRVPSQCRKTGARTITCDGGELAISPVSVDDLPKAEREMHLDQEAFLKELCPGYESWVVECTLDETPASCHVGLCDDEKGVLQTIVALGAVRGQAYAASCRYDPQRHNGAMPSVCAQVLTLAPESLKPPATPSKDAE